jgi:hypothetical protein
MKLIPFNGHPTGDISWRVGHLTSVEAVVIFSSSRLMRTETYNGAKTYGVTWTEEAYSVQQTSDGGYILAGATITLWKRE